MERRTGGRKAFQHLFVPHSQNLFARTFFWRDWINKSLQKFRTMAQQWSGTGESGCWWLLQWLWWVLIANVSMVQTWFGIMLVAYFQALVSLCRHFFLLCGHSSGGWILHHGVRKHTPSQTIRIKCAMSGCQLTRASLSDEPGWEGGRHFADEGEGIVIVGVIVIVSIFAILLRFLHCRRRCV